MNADVPLSAPSSLPPGITGRKSEWNALSQSVAALCDGHGGVVLISGEAGVGKTVLVEALADEARTSGIVVLTATSYDLEVPTPYGLWQEVFQSAERYRDLPSPPSSLTDSDNLDNVSSTRELWDLATRQILAMTGRRPLLIVLEDLHWADQSSIEILRFLARQIAAWPVLIVVTYREIELTQAYPLYHLLPHLVRETRPIRLPLRPLDRQGSRAIIERRYPSMSPADVERLTAYLERYAEGNPFVIGELVGLLEERRILRLESDVWRLGELPEFAVPPLIRQLIEDRLENLSPNARSTLEIASVFGVEVPLELWKSMCATADSEDLNALEEVLQTSVLEAHADADLLRFRHALVRDAIYSGMNVLHRRQWHARIGAMLARRSGIDPGIVAHHFIQAGDERAADWLIESAQRTGRAFAFQEAIADYERALAILNLNPERLSDQVGVLSALAEAHRFTDTARALTYIDEAVELAGRIDNPGARVLSAWVQARVRGFDDQNALSDLIAASVEFEQLPAREQDRIASSPLGYVVSRATLAQDLANYGMFTAALEQAERFLSSHARPALRAPYIEFGNAHFGLGIACAVLGMPERARSAFESSRSYFRESGNFQMVSNSYYWELNSVTQVYSTDRPDERHRLQLEEVQANLHSEFFEVRTGERRDSTSETLILDGDWDACWSSANLRLGIPASRVPSARKLGEIEWLRGNPSKAREHIRTALPAGPDEPPGRRFFLHRQELQSIAAEIALDEGDFELARRWIGAFEGWLEWSSRVAGKATAELLWSRFHARKGNHERALQHAHRSLELSGDPPQPLSRLRVLRALGELHIASGKLEDAQRCLDEALVIAQASAAPYELALTQVVMAESLNRAGKAGEAWAMLGSALAAAEQLEAQPLLDRLDDIAPASEQTPLEPDEPTLGLTPRQLEVLRLLTRGMTDAEIADALFISRRTVHGHLNTIYSKLGVDTRTGAVARAYSEGIIST